MEAALFFWVISFSDKGKLIPIYQGTTTGLMNDPVPQALILTGIVIGASTTALLLTLIIELNKFTDSINLEQIEGMWD
jgi:multicomponent Na+:H+ antiporter subunit C